MTHLCYLTDFYGRFYLTTHGKEMIMKFIYGKNDLYDIDRAEENCYLLTNGLGGFSSLTIAGTNARCDHTLFMAALTAPNKRYQLIENTYEELYIGEEKFVLSASRYVSKANNEKGNLYLNSFSFEYLPEYHYVVNGVEVIKTIVLKHEENKLGIKYEIINHGIKEVRLVVTPWLQFINKGGKLETGRKFILEDNKISSEKIDVYFSTNGTVKEHKTEYIEDLYFKSDAEDGRFALGCVAHNHSIIFTGEGEYSIIYSTEKVTYENVCNSVDEMISDEIDRKMKLKEVAGLKDEYANTLVMAANDYITYRESTNGKSILAGYPFFEDWGRDTMIALFGCTITTKQYEDAKSILRTFMKYCRKGIMPNLFPEGEDAPMYNTVDASLLFINAVYSYYNSSKDIEFVKEAYPVIEEIIKWYMTGTDFNIKMDEDGLISAGGGLDQVTWMDVRFGDILPTPRHGKPVEINAYWYNALMIMEEFSDKINVTDRICDFKELAERVQKSFLKNFWNEKEDCLKDLYSGTENDCQIRCNQIWAASMPYSMLDEDKADKVITKVFEELYTPLGLRSLSPKDKEFKPFYGGKWFDRDMAYHQGTVWGFPLGAYYLAYLKWAKDKTKAKIIVRRQLNGLEAGFREGCIGHIAEIYSGLYPHDSKGCFAQAWSVGELLRVYEELENME